jgi:hypothetical protein
LSTAPASWDGWKWSVASFIASAPSSKACFVPSSFCKHA